VGTLLSALGFWKRPARMADLLHPRFVVPGLFWFVGFFPMIFYALFTLETDAYGGYREEQSVYALIYLILCLTMFWVGFGIPLGGDFLRKMFGRLPAAKDLTRLRGASVVLALGTLVLLFAGMGSSLWTADSGAWLVPVEFMDYAVKYVVLPSTILAAIFYGLAWPAKGEPRTPGLYAAAAVVLAATSVPLAATFSRASGIMPILMVLGYALRHKRIPWRVTTLAILFVLYGAQVGISGRGIYGHYAGVYPYLQHMFDSSNLSGEELGGKAMSMDSLTPLSVVMSANQRNADLMAISPLEWIWFQVPIPHVTGLGGTFTFDPTLFLGGYGVSGYTPTMFGDTFGHLGWWGCLAFIYMGMLYRILENSVEQRPTDGEGLDLALLCLPIGYFAFMQGAFNTFRAWNSTFTFGIAGAVVGVYIFNKLTQRQAQIWSYSPESESSAKSASVKNAIA